MEAQTKGSSLLRFLGECISVRSIMSSPVFSLSTSDSLLSLIEAFEAKQVRHVPVMGEQNKVCAVVTEADTLAFAPSLTSGLSASEKAKVLARFTIWDLLYTKTKPPFVSVKAQDSILTAASKMKQSELDFATVYDDKDALVGILTEADFVRLFAGKVA